MWKIRSSQCISQSQATTCAVQQHQAAASGEKTSFLQLATLCKISFTSSSGEGYDPTIIRKLAMTRQLVAVSDTQKHFLSSKGWTVVLMSMATTGVVLWLFGKVISFTSFNFYCSFQPNGGNAIISNTADLTLLPHRALSSIWLSIDCFIFLSMY